MKTQANSESQQSGKQPAEQPSGEQRTVLLLQGLSGPLFQKLGEGLIRAGHRVHKINFNGGDRIYWRLPGGVDYRGNQEQWPGFLSAFITEHGITDVMLFGDCRSYHIAATSVCRALNVRVYVFEEGYVRPDWVTMEEGGVNGHSQLPKNPQWYRETAAALPPIPPHQRVLSSFRRRAVEGIIYNAADLLTRWYYPNWHNHRPWHPLVEAMGWSRKLLTKKKREAQATVLLNRLEVLTEPYFLFPMQLDSDAQIRIHSPFAGIADALKLVITSFSMHAPANARLVVKEHPLDNGVRDWALATQDFARMCGVEDRVTYVAGGDIETMAARAKGVVTVNSTSGTLALAKGVPVKVLGQAVYDIPDITFQQPLEMFWNDPPPPDAETFLAFQRVLIERCLIPGGFFSEPALEKVVEHAVARFERRSGDPI